MANKDGHRRFGNVRKLPSRRYQIRFPGPDGGIRTGPETYERKGDADRALVLTEASCGRVSGRTLTAARSGFPITPRSGSLSARDCVHARPTITGGCSRSTLIRILAVCRSASCRRR